MRALKLPYGRSEQVLHIDESRLRAVIAPREVTSDEDQEGLVRRALQNPIASPRLSELAAGAGSVLIITSDHTRPVPSGITMPLLLSEIRAGNPDAQITLLIATGMHRPTTEAELRARFGDGIVDRERIVVHRATEEKDMAYFGRLPSGGELWLNKLVKEADLVIAEGFIEPHFFAGFSGGRKAILPGVASAKTVLYNHNARFIADPNARQGSLTDNPIHRDMLYAAKQAKLRFILNVLIDRDKRVIRAVAGDPEEAHRAGCRMCEENNRCDRAEADVVITTNGGYPLDQNVYQSVKGMTAAEACVRPGGVIVMCAALGDGHGGEAFYRWFADRKDASEVTRDIEHVPPERTHMDQWEAQILARIQQKARCVFVTGEENRALIEQMHMVWMPDVDRALAYADGLLGGRPDVVVIPDGVSVIL
ncbi:MAG: nickel-dependent lactate racemase [Clostridia bacterium]|nr:nickel-dependent lactate racemase [Clostridia bacterium]